MPQADDSVAYFPSLFVCRHGSPDLPGPPFQAFPGPSCIIFLAVVSFRRKKSAATPIPSYLCIQIGFDKLLYSHLCTNLTIKTDHDCGEFLHGMFATVIPSAHRRVGAKLRQLPEPQPPAGSRGVVTDCGRE